jgi:hypothetical protein
MTPPAARRAGLGIGAVALVTGLLLAVGPARSYGGSRPTFSAAPAAACPVATHPPDAAHDPYQVTFSGTLSGALSITASPAGAVNLPSVTGTFCGLLELPLEQADVAPANLSIAPVEAAIARATVPAAVVGTGQTVGSVSLTPAADNGLNLTLDAPVAARTGLFGVECELPVSLALSTTAPGGSALVGPLDAAHAVVTESGFTIEPAVSTGTSGTCPGYLATQVDGLLGLPNSATTTIQHVDLDIVIP